MFESKHRQEEMIPWGTIMINKDQRPFNLVYN